MGIPASQIKKRKTTISKRQKIQREIFLAELRKNSVITVACQKSGISRSTAYRWMNEEPEFVNMAEGAIAEGRAVINDMAESVLMKKIREENLAAAKFWLTHNNERYRPWRNSYSGINDYREVQSMKEKLKSFFEEVFKKREK